MEPITSKLRVPSPVKDRRTKRGELLKEACELVNRGRKEKGYGLVPIGRMAAIMKGVPDDDLWATLKECKSAKQPGALLWYKLSAPKKV